MPGFSTIVEQLPTEWIENYVRTFEAGRVQKHPHARFVNARGECCLVAALAGIRRSEEFAGTALSVAFLGSPLEALSRAFEGRRVTGQEFYEEALLALAAHAVADRELVAV
jgi:hypothetical protein